MRWFPSWSWLVTPSGGATDPTAPWWKRLGRWLYDAPIIAHPAGAWLVVAFMAIGGVQSFGAWWAVLLAEGVNQWHKVLDKDYGSDTAGIVRNVVWRMLLSAVATLPVWWGGG
jgi:hypothetical protein